MQLPGQRAQGMGSVRADLPSAGLLLGTPSCTRLEASLRASPPHLPNHKYTQASSKSNSFDHFQLLIVHY